MDHIPSPRAPQSRTPRVKIFSSANAAVYDDKPFFGYLKRIGWQPDDITRANTSSKSCHDIHAVLQAWTYFGLLHEVTGLSSQSLSDKLIQRDSRGEATLSSHGLTDILQQWISKVNQQPSQGFYEHSQHISECLTIVAEIYAAIYRGCGDFLDKGLHLSIKLLCEYVAIAATLAGTPLPSAHKNEKWVDTLPVTQLPIPGSDRLICERMRRDGWCESEIHMLLEFTSTTELAFASLLDRPGPSKNHAECKSDRCTAYQVSKDSSYATRHVDHDCRCDFVYASTRDLGAILLDGAQSVPLVSCKRPERNLDDGKLYVELVKSKTQEGTTRKYVALSHVWSDGLGNNQSNSIPLCQFRRIIGLTSALYHNTDLPFWFDTLCFPLEPQTAYDEALVRMRQSYQDADKVLVLDSYLLAQDMVYLSPEEIAVRVMCSPWNKRLWTLQEGMLAQSLAFQFRDKFVDLAQWASRVCIEDSATLQNLIFQRVWAYYCSLRVFETASDKKMNLLQAKRALGYRSTSELDDEPLCLGNLLGINPEDVVHARTRECRMEVIWGSIPQHFASPIFWAGPKLSKSTYRWAPASLLGEKCAGALSDISPPAKWDPEAGGLLVTLPGIILENPFVVDADTIRVFVKPDYWILVQWNKRWQIKKPEDLPSKEERRIQSSSSGREKFVLLMRRPFRGSIHDSRDMGFFARLCDVLAVSDQCINIRLLGRVRVYRLETLKHHPDKLLPLNRPEEARASGESSDPRGVSQSWPTMREKERSIWDYDQSLVTSSGKLVDKGTWCIEYKGEGASVEKFRCSRLSRCLAFEKLFINICANA